MDKKEDIGRMRLKNKLLKRKHKVDILEEEKRRRRFMGRKRLKIFG
jgi:hypothetical protein